MNTVAPHKKHQKNHTFLAIIKKPRFLFMVLLGFSAGIPILLVFSTLSAWLRDAGISRSEIGYISWVALAYGFKWVWSPLVDTISIPLLSKALGRRRSWILLSQCCIVISIFAISASNPQTTLSSIVLWAIVLAFCSATQDIVIDAFRIESGNKNEQALLASLYVYGYRIALLLSGAGVLWLADNTANVYSYTNWAYAYKTIGFVMIGCMILSAFTLHEPNTPEKHYTSIAQWGRKACIDPFKDFYYRFGRSILLVFLIVCTFRISDIVMGVMANPFYLDTGFSKTEIALIVKIFGLPMTLIGLGVGGILMLRLKLYKTMMLALILSAGTNVFFAILSQIGANTALLSGTIALDNLSAGIATTTFIAYLSNLTSKDFSATQYALLSSFMVIVPKFLAGFSGVVVDTIGYSLFFILTATLSLPTFIFLYFDKTTK